MNTQPERQFAKLADALAATRHVFVRDLRLQAVIGVHDHEKRERQPIVVNVDLAVSEKAAPLEDQLGEVVCYKGVVDAIQEIVDAGHVNLVETLAERIADRCLEDGRVSVARVRVEKPQAISNAGCVGVEIERYQR